MTDGYSTREVLQMEALRHLLSLVRHLLDDELVILIGILEGLHFCQLLIEFFRCLDDRQVDYKLILVWSVFFKECVLSLESSQDMKVAE